MLLNKRRTVNKLISSVLLHGLGDATLGCGWCVWDVGNRFVRCVVDAIFQISNSNFKNVNERAGWHSRFTDLTMCSTHARIFGSSQQQHQNPCENVYVMVLVMVRCVFAINTSTLWYTAIFVLIITTFDPFHSPRDHCIISFLYATPWWMYNDELPTTATTTSIR